MRLLSVVLALVFVVIAMILLPYVVIQLNIDLVLPVYLTPVSKYLGPSVILIGAILDLWCIYLFLTVGKGTPVPVDPPQILVAQGVYKRSRNPMYIGYIVIIFGEFLFFGHLLLFFYTLLALILCHLFVVFYEEPILKKRFGQTYLEYLQKTPRWI